jgi:5-methylcytosine-specific restriction enzyme subunit McrC
VTDVSLSLEEWQSLGPDDDKAGDLAGYCFESPEVRALARRLTQARVIELRPLDTGLAIRARSHVGRIRVGRLTLTIHPKIAPDCLLRLFRYAYGLGDMKRYAAVSYALGGGLFQDLVIAQLYIEVRRLIERGVARAYVEERSWLRNPRGQIDFAQIAASGGVFEAALPCRHHPRSSDHLLNRVVLAGLGLARRLAHDRALSISVGRLERALGESASPIPLSSAVLRRADRAINRLVERYRSVVRLIEILHFGSLVQLDDDRTSVRLPGFLFDMNRFFQALLLRFLTENLPEHEVAAEHGLVEMMRYAPGHNPRRRRARCPRPDYALKQRHKVVALLDAKYRDLWDKGLTRDMLYQLSIYALSQPQGSTATILYPATDPAARPEIIEILTPLSDAVAGRVAQHPVHLEHLTTLIDGRDVEARRDYARMLAGTQPWRMLRALPKAGLHLGAV